MSVFLQTGIVASARTRSMCKKYVFETNYGVALIVFLVQTTAVGVTTPKEHWARQAYKLRYVGVQCVCSALTFPLSFCTHLLTRLRAHVLQRLPQLRGGSPYVYPGLLSESAAHASRIHRQAVEAKEAERARIAVSCVQTQ